MPLTSRVMTLFAFAISMPVFADLRHELALVEREYEGTVNAIAWVNVREFDRSTYVPVPGRLMEFSNEQVSRDHAFDSPLRSIAAPLRDLGVHRIWYYIVDGGLGAGVLKIVIPCETPEAILPLIEMHFQRGRFRDLKVSVKPVEGGVSVRLLEVPETAMPIGAKWTRVFASEQCDFTGHGYVNTRVSTLWVPEVQPQLRTGNEVATKAAEIVRDMESIVFYRSKDSEWPRVVMFFSSPHRAEKVCSELQALYESNRGKIDGLQIAQRESMVITRPSSSTSLDYLASIVSLLREEDGPELP